MKKHIRIYNDMNRFTIDWTLNTLCTYKCSYCTPQLYAGKNFLYSKEEDPILMKEFLEKLKHDLGNRRSVHMFLNGGEPTISPSIETILDFCNDNDWSAYVNTNGSRSMEWWREYARKAFKITISYHPESVDDEIFDKVAYIGTQTNVGVYVLMYPPYWDKAMAAYERFAKSDLTLGVSRVFKRNEQKPSVSYEYTDEQLAWMDKNSLRFSSGFRDYNEHNAYGRTLVQYDDGSEEILNEVEFTNNLKNSFTGWSCNMGMDHIFIDSFGRIKTATCPKAPLVANSIKEYNGLLKNPIICPEQYCMCTLDVQIPKQPL